MAHSIYNFRQVDDKLYRGTPTASDIDYLYDVYDIRKIVSLDEAVGESLSEKCKELGIEHIMCPVSYRVDDPGTIRLINEMPQILQSNNGNVLVHCHWSKDRTGMAVAMYRVANGWSFEQALEEAKSYHFGEGLHPEVVKNYTDAIKTVATIFKKASINEDEELKELKKRQKQIDYEKLTRMLKAYEDGDVFVDDEAEHVPMVGIWDNSFGPRGAGPVETGGIVQLDN